MTNTSFLTLPTLAELKNVALSGGNNLLSGSNGKPRKLNCTNCEHRHFRTRINPDSRRMDLRTLPANKTVLIGAMVPPQDLPEDDATYNIGKGKPGNFNAITRAVFVFLTKSNGPPTSTVDAVEVARYSFVTVDAQNTVTVRQGKAAMECRLPHYNSTGPESDFVACRKLSSLDSVGRSVGITFEQVLAARASAIGGKLDDEPASMMPPALEALPFLRDKSAAQFAMLRDYFKLDDPSTDPYWFSCGTGCCIAEI